MRSAGPGIVVAALLLCAGPARADEARLSLTGQVDAGEIGAGGPFTLRALRPQKRTVQLGTASSDAAGRFTMPVDLEAVAVYGVVLEASSAGDPALVLEAVLLSVRDARAPVSVGPGSTVAAAMIEWKVRRHEPDFERVRPFLLLEWLRPLVAPKARTDLKRAELLLVRWARAAAPPGGSVASVLKGSVGDPRRLRARLGSLNVGAAAIDDLERLARRDAEVAYLLMLPYLLEL